MGDVDLREWIIVGPLFCQVHMYVRRSLVEWRKVEGADGSL